ncbi:MAG: ribosome maturation factor RimP [Eggerthellaceae bacterium]|nr:ribosome maturation factor RimP [Eggerthellaceae bacterium]
MEKQLLAALEAHAQQHDVEIVAVEISGSRKSPTVSVFIDTDHGVSFDELSSAQAWINDLFDVIDPFPGAYRLEVSSPGIDRPLRTQAHFADVIGQQATVKLLDSAAKKTLKGTITAAEEETFTIETDDGLRTIAYDEVHRAHLIGIIDFKS